MKSVSRSVFTRLVAFVLILVALVGVFGIAAPVEADAASVSKSATTYKVSTSGCYVVKSNTARLRTSPSWISATYATLDKGAVVSTNGAQGDYYKLSVGGKTLYIKKSDVQKAPSQSSSQLYYTTKSAPLYKGPYDNTGKVTTVSKGQVVTVVGTLKNTYNNRWLIVSYGGKLLYMYSGNAKYTSKVTLQISGAANTVNVNNTIKLNGITSPSGLTVTWSSSNQNVATVDQNGTVRGVNPGIVTVTAKVGNIVTATYKVNVDLILNVKAVRQTTNYTCSAASSLVVLRYYNKATGTSDKTLYASTDGYVYKIRNVLNKYLGSGTYCYNTFTSVSAYEKAIVNSLKQGSPVIARVAFSKGYFNYKSNGHYTTIVGITYDANGTPWLKLVDSFTHNYKSNTYTNASAGTVSVPLRELYNYGTYSGRSAIYLIYNP